jgi:hypothetical protein
MAPPSACHAAVKWLAAAEDYEGGLMKGRLALAVCLTMWVAASARALAQPNVPVMVYRQSGGFPPIPTTGEILVYTDGEAIFTKFPASFGYCQAGASSARVSRLQSELAAAGAFFLRDGPPANPDEPLATMTFFVPVGDLGRARSNTFTYPVQAPGSYVAIEKVVQSFIADVFPNC